MKALFENIVLKRVNLYGLHALVFLLSFQERFVPISLVLYLVLSLFTISWSERIHYFKKRKKYILLFISFYLVSLFGMLYTLNVSEGLFDLEVKLSILLVPLFFLTSNVINKYSVFGVLKTFIAGVVISLGLQFVLAIINYYYTSNYDVFFYSLLSYFHHPAYFAMYVNFAIASILILIYHYKNRPQLAHFVLLGFLIIGIYQLGSRSGFLTLFVLVFYAIIYIVFPRLRWKKTLYAFLGLVLVVSAIIYPIVKYTNSLREVDVSSAKSSSGVRIEMWKSSVSLIKENFVFGVGTGDVNRDLQQNFAKERINRAVRDNLNAHNQFIQTQVSLGILGLIALLIGLMYPFYISVRKGKFLYPLFVTILLVNFLTESVLNTQAGVIYFAVLNSVLFITYED